MSDFSALANAHPSYIESLYNNWKQNPSEVATDWEQFFTGFDFAVANGEVTPSTEGGATEAVSSEKLRKELAVATIIDGYRHRGHLLADTNPIRKRKDRKPHLDFHEWGLEDADLELPFYSGKLLGLENATLRQIIERLNMIYAAHIGFDYSHIDKHEQRLWLRERIEQRNFAPDFGLSMAKKQRILEKLNGAVGMEEFLAKKYGPMKRFGLEGGENTIAAIDAIINEGATQGVEEVVIGMAHRGRLNMLANIMGKTYQNIFNEFEGGIISDQIYGSGDVKYHMGYSSQMETVSGKLVHLKLLPNPSHLESIDPVIEGFARAKVDLLYENKIEI